MSTKLYQVGL